MALARSEARNAAAFPSSAGRPPRGWRAIASLATRERRIPLAEVTHHFTARQAHRTLLSTRAAPNVRVDGQRTVRADQTAADMTDSDARFTPSGFP
jgi:hypothetical protein